MILKLTGADFSKNNLGTIGILRDETKEILNNYSKILSETQKFAVQNFILELKSNDIWSSITNLYIPLLAGKLSETMYNIKTKTIDTIPNATEYDLSTEGGLKCTITNPDNALTNPVYFLYNGSQQSLHCLFYNTKNLDINQSIIDGFGTDTNGVGGNTNWITCSINPSVLDNEVAPTVKTDKNIGVSFGTTYKNNYFSKVPSFQGWTQRTDGNVILGSKGAILNSDSTPISTDNTYTNKPIYPFLKYTKKVDVNGSFEFGILSMGSGLSNEKLLKYREVVNKLINALSV